MRILKILVLAIVVAGGIGWWAIGPDWRGLLVVLPTDDKVLSWSQAQRSAAFRMMDQVTMLVKSREIHNKGGYVRDLPAGKPLDVNLDSFMADNDYSGIVIIQDGKVRAEGYGLDWEPGRWTSFSVAKSFSSTMVGAAVKDGLIKSMDDPVSNYIKGLAGTPYDNVSIRELLTMSSGVAWNEDYEDPNSDVAQFNLHKAKDGLPIIVSYFQNAKRARPAGEKFNYSTGETNMIGILIEEATGRTLTDYVAEKIWAPAGMAEMGSWLLGRDGHEISGCCIQASTRDFARYGLFMLDGAKGPDGQSIVPSDWIATATNSQVDTPYEGEGYGYQWWTYNDGTYAARGIFGQGIFIDPKRNLVIASNASWERASQKKDKAIREAFYKSVQAAVDAE